MTDATLRSRARDISISATEREDAGDVGIYTIGLAPRRDPHGRRSGSPTRRCSGLPASLSALSCSPSRQMGVPPSLFLHITTDRTTPTTCWRWRSRILHRVPGRCRFALDHDNLNDNHGCPPAELDEYANAALDRKDKTTRSSYGRGAQWKQPFLNRTRRIATFKPLSAPKIGGEAMTMPEAETAQRRSNGANHQRAMRLCPSSGGYARAARRAKASASFHLGARP